MIYYKEYKYHDPQIVGKHKNKKVANEWGDKIN